MSMDRTMVHVHRHPLMQTLIIGTVAAQLYDKVYKNVARFRQFLEAGLDSVVDSGMEASGLLAIFERYADRGANIPAKIKRGLEKHKRKYKLLIVPDVPGESKWIERESFMIEIQTTLTVILDKLDLNITNIEVSMKDPRMTNASTTNSSDWWSVCSALVKSKETNYFKSTENTRHEDVINTCHDSGVSLKEKIINSILPAIRRSFPTQAVSERPTGATWLSSLLNYISYVFRDINDTVDDFVRKWTHDKFGHHMYGKYRRNYLTWKRNDLKTCIQPKKNSDAEGKRFLSQRDELERTFADYFFENYADFEQSLSKPFNQQGEQLISALPQIWYPNAEESLQDAMDVIRGNFISTDRDMREIASETDSLYDNLHELVPESRLSTCAAIGKHWLSYARVERGCLAYLSERSWTLSWKSLYYFHLYYTLVQIKSALESQKRFAELKDLDRVLRDTVDVEREVLVMAVVRGRIGSCFKTLTDKLNEMCGPE